jgi:hypothetical protein
VLGEGNQSLKNGMTIQNEAAKYIEDKELARIRQDLTRVADLNDRLVGVLVTKASPEEIRRVLEFSE